MDLQVKTSMSCYIKLVQIIHTAVERKKQESKQVL